MIKRPRSYKRTAQIGIVLIALSIITLVFMYLNRPEKGNNGQMCGSDNIVYQHKGDYQYVVPDMRFYPDLDCQVWTKGGLCAEEEEKPSVKVEIIDEPVQDFMTPNWEMYPPAPAPKQSPRVRVLLPFNQGPTGGGIKDRIIKPPTTILPDRKVPCEVSEPVTWVLMIAGLVVIAMRLWEK